MSLAVVRAEELGPYYPASRAPLDPKKQTFARSSISRTDLNEIIGEFGGLLYMAQRKYSYEKWPGREMADCRPSSGESWCYHCNLMMGHSNADYYFYQDTGRGCTLQQIDAHFPVSDPEVLRSLKRTAQPMFGVPAVRDHKPASKESGWDGSGPGWKWETSEDLAFLYMNQEEPSDNGQGTARFQWRQAPLHRSSR